MRGEHGRVRDLKGRTGLKRCSLVGLVALVVGTQMASPARGQTVVDSINADKSPKPAEWSLTEVGWFFTPSSSYSLGGVQSKFSDQGTITRLVTIEVRSAGGNVIGDVLRSGSFTLEHDSPSSLFQGASFAPLGLTAGTQYFIGFRNTDSTGAIVTEDAGATNLGLFRFGRSNLGTYENAFNTSPNNRLGQPILRFLGPADASAVPEPSALAALVPALLGVLALNRGRLRSARRD